ncbi:MAG: sodium:calcium antiporter, partial [Myxococcota bacterium]
NLLGVLGLAAFIRPLAVGEAARGSLRVLVVMVCIVVLFMRSGWKVSRPEGILLVCVSMIRWWIAMSGGPTTP